MAKLVEVEHYGVDGTHTVRRMRLSEWNELFEKDTKAEGGFYVVWWKMQRRWDGSRRKSLYSTACQVGYRVEFRDSSVGCCRKVIPFLVADDE